MPSRPPARRRPLPLAGLAALSIAAAAAEAPGPAPDPPAILLEGRRDKYRNTAVAAGQTIDARKAVFEGSELYPVTLNSRSIVAGAAFLGGRVQGTFDRGFGWSRMHDPNRAAFDFMNLSPFTVDGLRADNHGDGIRPRDGCDGFAIRNVHLSYIRDDGVENDHLFGGLVDDCLLDGCYVGFSARPSPRISNDGRDKVWRIEHSLVRLQAMPGPDKGPSPGHGPFFKWDHDGRSPRLALHGNVFRADRPPNHGSLGIPEGKLQSAAENVMVWLGPGPFPEKLPEGFEVKTGDEGREIWDRAVADWKRRHGEAPEPSPAGPAPGPGGDPPPAAGPREAAP